jgi:hypothetical protein
MCEYYPPFENLPIFDVTVFRLAQDVVEFATNTGNININNTTSGTSYYPTFVDSSSGYKRIMTNDSSYTYNASTNTISANTSGTAAVGTVVTVSNTTLQTIWYPCFVRGSGNQAVRVSTSQFSYELLTNELSVNITGSAAVTNTVAVQDNNTGNTYYLTFVTANALGTNKEFYIDSITDTLSYVPSTSTLSCSNFIGLASNATNATNVALTSDNDNGAFYILYSKTQSPTSNALYIDDTTSGLTYNPFTSRLFLGTANFTNANILLNSANFNVGSGAGGVSNTLIGNSTPRAIVFTTGNNTLVGTSAGQNASISAASNTCLGSSSGLGITSGTQNTFIGDGAGFQIANGTGSSNVCVGFQSGDAMTTTANENTIIGSQSATALTTGTDNVIIGFNAAASLTTGSNNIVIGSGANVLAGASNEIDIGTNTQTMYIQGGFNWRVGAQITNTATGNLATAVLAQFYTVAMSAASQTIALPNPTGAAYLGARVTFKRKTNTTVFTITSTGGAGFLPIASTTLSASSISISATVFQVDLVCDGVNWCIISQA